MKQSIILWIAAITITFLAGYAQRIKSPVYPINGTLDLVTGEASFSFDKVYGSKDGYKVLIVNNCKDLQGTLRWKDKGDTASWHSVPMNSSGEALSAVIPAHQPLSEVEYRVTLVDQDQTFLVPVKEPAVIKFIGRVPSQIAMNYYLTLFAGLLLAIRTGFEIFKNKPRLRLYAIFTIISFFSFTFIFSTVKKGCELGIIGGTKIAPITDIFSSGPILLFAWWLLAIILIFNSHKPKIWAGAASVGTILIFLLGKF